MRQPSIRVEQRRGPTVDDNATAGEVRYVVVSTTNTIVHKIGAVLTPAQVAELISLGIDVDVRPFKG